MLFFLLNANSQCFNIVDFGNSFTMGLKSDGTIWAWGENYQAEFGNGTTTGSTLPIQIGNDTNWASISTGGHYTLALKNDGTLWAWGNNSSGQLGDGTTVTKNIPIQIGTENDWQSISTRGYTSFAIKNNGTLWGWGQNNVSKIGLGFSSTYESLPTQVGTDTNWKEIIAGYDHNFAIKNDNTLWGWGANTYGQIGNGFFLGTALIPTQIGTESNWKTASLGHEQSIAIKLDGSLWAWGGNSYGELGDGSTTNRNAPVQIGNETNWKSVSADYFNSYAIKNDNTLWGWGNNSYYQFGNNSTISSTSPIQIGNETNWKYITPGAYQKLAMKNDNSISLWGVNPFGLSAYIANNTSVTQFIEGCTVLSSENFNVHSIQVYPNPCNEQLFIELANNFEEYGNTEAQLFNIQGQVLRNIALKSPNTTIQVDDLMTGVYFVTIKTSKGSFTEKIVKN